LRFDVGCVEARTLFSAGRAGVFLSPDGRHTPATASALRKTCGF
jgi:hypothetical protein